MTNINIVDYNPAWPIWFESLRSTREAALGNTALAIEHVGSTSVPGLLAKPIIDIDVVVADISNLHAAIQKLSSIGYRHLGDLGVEGREAFDTAHKSPPHHLYVCPQGSLGLRNHLAIRDALRSDCELATNYGELKTHLSHRYANDIDRYVDGKTEFLVGILVQCGFPIHEIASIRTANRLD